MASPDAHQPAATVPSEHTPSSAGTPSDRIPPEAFATRVWRAVLDARAPGLRQRYWEAAMAPGHYRVEGGRSPRGQAVLEPLEREMAATIASLVAADDAEIRAVLLMSDDAIVREAALLASPDALRQAIRQAVEA